MGMRSASKRQARVAGARQPSAYEEGPIVEFRTNLSTQNFARGDRSVVRSADRERVALTVADGPVRQFRPEQMPHNLAHDAVSIFQSKDITLHAGDRIRWTDNERARAAC